MAYSRGTVVPAGMTYLENLYANIMDEACRLYQHGKAPPRGKPPRGFRVRPRGQQGHFRWPGESMELDGTNLSINDALETAPVVSQLHDEFCLDYESYLLKTRKIYHLRRQHARRIFGPAVKWKAGDKFSIIRVWMISLILLEQNTSKIFQMGLYGKIEAAQ